VALISVVIKLRHYYCYKRLLSSFLDGDCMQRHSKSFMVENACGIDAHLLRDNDQLHSRWNMRRLTKTDHTEGDRIKHRFHTRVEILCVRRG